MLTKLKSAFKLWMRASDFKSLTEGDFERFEEMLRLNGLQIVATAEPIRTKTLGIKSLYDKVYEVASGLIDMEKYTLRVEFDISSNRTVVDNKIHIYERGVYNKDVVRIDDVFDELVILTLVGSQIQTYITGQKIELVADGLPETKEGGEV